jgi:hypothetical protein
VRNLVGKRFEPRQNTRAVRGNAPRRAVRSRINLTDLSDKRLKRKMNRRQNGASSFGIDGAFITCCDVYLRLHFVFPWHNIFRFKAEHRMHGDRQGWMIFGLKPRLGPRNKIESSPVS